MKILLLTLLLFTGITAQTLSIPNMDESGTFVVPVEIYNPAGMIAYQFHIATDAARPVSCESAVETFAVNCNVVGNTMYVGGYSGYELEESGVLVNITFRAGKKGCSAVTISENMLFNIFGLIDSEVSNGKVCLN